MVLFFPSALKSPGLRQHLMMTASVEVLSSCIFFHITLRQFIGYFNEVLNAKSII
jgi:hypothetical protein